MDKAIGTAVLKEAGAGEAFETLYLVLEPQFGPKAGVKLHEHIPVYRRGSRKAREFKGRPAWEYEEQDGKLLVTPSLHLRHGRIDLESGEPCVPAVWDTVFHGPYAWEVEFVRQKAGGSGFEELGRLNP